MATAEILVVEDELNVAFVVAAALRLAGFTVTETALGTEALRIAADRPVDLMVLDLGLDDIDGFKVCQRLRAAGSDIPVVFLTARDATADRVRGLTLGGDDYLTKPFSVEELVARVRAILRRSGKVTDGQVYRCGSLVLDDDTYRVTCGDEFVELSPTEYKLLRFLLRNSGRVLTRRQIIDHVWDYDFDGESTLVETFVSTLRKKIGVDGPRLIQTVRGIGYRMAES